MQLQRQKELDETVDSFFDRNKLYIKTAREHETNKSPRSTSKEPMYEVGPQMQAPTLKNIRQS